MKQFFVKRIMVTLAIMVACTMTAAAQEGLNVDRVFQRFGKSKGCKMVVMKNTELRGYKLHTYKSLVYKNLYSAIEPYLAADKKSAKKVREVVEEGRIVSGYYMMAPLRDGINRYILFCNVGGHKGTVIYIEGTLSPDDIMKLCYSKV